MSAILQVYDEISYAYIYILEYANIIPLESYRWLPVP